MARVTHVKAAQQRYRTVPVLDEAGHQVYRTQNLARPSKKGKTSYQQKVVREDREQPLPPETCGFCHKPIEVGTPYKHVTIKKTYGGVRHVRHAGCPSWQPWELSDALWARVAQIQNDVQENDPETMEAVIEQIRDLASEKEEAADSLESGFGHVTYQSEEILRTAEELNGWADEIESAYQDLDGLEEHEVAEVDPDDPDQQVVWACTCEETFTEQEDAEQHAEIENSEREDKMSEVYELIQNSPL